jgi:hypothetical protein
MVSRSCGCRVPCGRRLSSAPRCRELKFGEARDYPAHREGRKGRYAKRPAFLRAVLGPQRTIRQPVECWACLGQEIRPGQRRHGVAAGAHEEPNAKPILKQADLPAYRAMGDVELFCRAAEAAEPCSSLEGLDRIQWRQARANHAVSFSHMGCQNKSFVIKPS